MINALNVQSHGKEIDRERSITILQCMKSEPTSKRTMSRGPAQRDTKEVPAERVETLRKKLDPKVEAGSTGEEDRRGQFRRNFDRLTVVVDLGTNGATTAFWVCRGKRWRRDSCIRRRLAPHSMPERIRQCAVRECHGGYLDVTLLHECPDQTRTNTTRCSRDDRCHLFAHGPFV